MEELTVHGTRLLDSEPVELAQCRIRGIEASCKGRRGKAKYRITDSRDFLYSFPFPLLLRPLLLNMPMNTGQTLTKELVMMTLGDSGPRLEPARAAVKYGGEEVLSLAGNNFKVHKYSIEIRAPNQPLDITVWTLEKSVILAMDEGHFPRERMALTKFKKYSEF